MVSFQCSCMENVIFFSLLPVCAVHCLSAALLYTSEQRCKLKETDQRQTVVLMAKHLEPLQEWKNTFTVNLFISSCVANKSCLFVTSDLCCTLSFCCFAGKRNI